MRLQHNTSTTAVVVIIVLGLAAGAALAHCDTVDGPVVIDAKEALEAGDVQPVLIWVHEEDEDEIREAFNKTLEVRKLSPKARELADMYFFETLVRVHRASEGAPYTGLKPANHEASPAIEAADKALESGNPSQLYGLIDSTVDQGLRKHYQEVVAKKHAWKPGDTEAGREWVKAYVEYIHYADGIYKAASGSVHGDSSDKQH